MSISTSPKFDRHSCEPVWYLAHPVAGDSTYTYEQNLTHIVELVRFFFRDCNLRVMAPYHTMLLALDDANDDERIVGLETDLTIVRQTNRVILAGHKISSGMTDELLAGIKSQATVWNFVGLNKRRILETKEIRDHIASFAARELDRKTGGKGLSFETNRIIAVGGESNWAGGTRCRNCGHYQ